MLLQEAAKACALANEAETVLKLLERTAGARLTRNKVGGCSVLWALLCYAGSAACSTQWYLCAGPARGCVTVE